MSRKKRMKAMTEEVEMQPAAAVPTADRQAAEESEVLPQVSDAAVEEDVVPSEDGNSSEVSACEDALKETETLSQDEEAVSPKKKRYVKYSPLSLILLGICAFVFSFSLLGVFEQTVLDMAGGSEISKLLESVFGPDGGKGGVSEDGAELYPSVSAVGEWQAISPESIDTDALPLLQSVGFDVLLEQNPDTVAWMYWPTTVDVKGLPFNLPVVQSEDNDYYLSKSFDRTYSVNGWIFADYRCDLSDITSNRNTIFYGHARSYLIFGGLRYLNSKTKWQQDANNHFIYINTPDERTVWQVFSWYETTTAFNYIDTHFSSNAEYVAFLNTLQSNNTISAFERFEFTADNRILTLSTCKGSNSDVRIAVHAVLVKHEKNGVLQSVVTNTATGEPPEVNPSAGGTSGTTHVTDVTDITDTTGLLTDVATDGSVSSTDAGVPPTTDAGTPTDVPVTDVSSENSTVSADSSGAPAEPPSTDTGTPPDTGGSTESSSEATGSSDVTTDNGTSSAPEVSSGTDSQSTAGTEPSADTGTPSDGTGVS